MQTKFRKKYCILKACAQLTYDICRECLTNGISLPTRLTRLRLLVMEWCLWKSMPSSLPGCLYFMFPSQFVWLAPFMLNWKQITSKITLKWLLLHFFKLSCFFSFSFNMLYVLPNLTVTNFKNYAYPQENWGLASWNQTEMMCTVTLQNQCFRKITTEAF